MSNVSDKHGPDQDLPDEQQLDEYLRGGSAVSRQYRQLPSADVPAEIDRLVLRQAQEAVKSRPARSRTWVRWTGPLALAASAVLVVSIVIESGVHEDTYLSVPASAPAEVSAMKEAAEQPGVRNSADADKARDNSAAGSTNDESVVHIMPPPAVADMHAPAPFLPEEPAPSEERALAIPPVAPAPMPAPQFTSPAPEAPAEQPPAELARRAEGDAISETVVTARRATAPPQASASTPISVIDEDELQQVIITGVRRPPKQTAGPRNTVVPATADSGSHADEEEADESPDYSDPEQWLRDIRELRKENKQREADREWRRFRYVFPNYEVAKDDPARGALR